MSKKSFMIRDLQYEFIKYIKFNDEIVRKTHIVCGRDNDLYLGPIISFINWKYVETEMIMEMLNIYKQHNFSEYI